MTKKLFPLAIAACMAMIASGVAFAEPHCGPTARIAASHYPGARAIPPNNNLLLPNGKAVEPDAQRLIIRGRLVDSSCMPIADAVVELWQVDPFGHWLLAEEEDLATPDPVFAGAGRAVTNGNGEFTFTTGFPGILTYRTVVNKKTVTRERAPHINLKVKAHGFSEFSTILFFDSDRRNAGDPVYTKLSAAERPGVTLTMNQEENGDLTGAVTLTLAGHVPYRTY